MPFFKLQLNGILSTLKRIGGILMIKNTFEEVLSDEWVKANITNPVQELVIIRGIIPWQKMITKLCKFYNTSQGAFGKSLRMMTAILICIKYYQLSDRQMVKHIKENHYIQYFCNITNEELQTCLDPSSICVFRKRIGEEGVEIIEKEVFEVLHKAGIIQGDNAMIDSSVLKNNVIYPNDVHLIFKAFDKMKQFAVLHQISLWWDNNEVKKLWREFFLNKKQNRLEWLLKFNILFIPALKIFGKKVESLKTTKKKQIKADNMFAILTILEAQTLEKLEGKKQIKNRIVSIDEPDARPIVKGKEHPKCEFGTTMEMTFNREGFMITIENFIGNPNDKTLFAGTLEQFKKRMKGEPENIITDLGYRSNGNFKIADNISNVFLGRKKDVSEEKQNFCCKARSATEGFIAIAKNIRGFGCSLYRGFEGDRIWSLLCQTAYNLKKFIQLLMGEKIEEKKLMKLGLA